MENKIKLLYLIIILCPVIFSCSHKRDNPVPVPDPTLKIDYRTAIQLKQGNYWVYSSKYIYLRDSSMTQEPDDSIYVSKDSVINNIKYSFIQNIYGLTELWRESSGNIVDNNNNIVFSGTDFKDTLYKSLDGERGFMTGADILVSVPAGTFKTACYIVIWPGVPHSFLANDPTIYDSNHVILRKTWYAKDIGIIKTVVYYGNENVTIQELLRYHVN